jgi:hypothetical protein
MPMFNNGEIVFDAFNDGISQEEAFMSGKQVFKNIVPWLVDGFEYSGRSYVPTPDVPADGLIKYDDGTSMYLLTRNGTFGQLDWISQYTLTTPWNITTAVYVDRFTVPALGSDSYGFDISHDGTKLWMFHFQGFYNTYTLTTPWDITTAVDAGQSFDASASQDRTHAGRVSADGTKYITGGQLSEDIVEFEMVTPFDISTSVATGATLDSSSHLQQLLGCCYADDESYVIATGISSPQGVASNVVQFELSTPNDVSTGTEVSDFNTNLPVSYDQGVQMGNSGVRMWIFSGSVYEFTAA